MSTISHRDNWKIQILNDQKSCLQLTLDTFELQADLYWQKINFICFKIALLPPIIVVAGR